MLMNGPIDFHSPVCVSNINTSLAACSPMDTLCTMDVSASSRSRGLKRKGGDLSKEGMDYQRTVAYNIGNVNMSMETIQTTNPTTIIQQQEEVSSSHSTLKQQKVTHFPLDDAKCTRVKFAPGIILRTKKLYQEPWGIMVSSLEDYPPLQIKVGQRFWAKWDGMSCPYSCRPILQAIHSVADATIVYT